MATGSVEIEIKGQTPQNIWPTWQTRKKMHKHQYFGSQEEVREHCSETAIAQPREEQKQKRGRIRRKKVDIIRKRLL